MNTINWPEVLKTAQGLAIEAHKNQLDKLGYAYIGHPRRVARNAESVPLGNEDLRQAAIVAAWLHDVVEDSPTTLEDLLTQGIPLIVVDAVELVSDMKTGTKDVYYAKIAAHPLARAVKLSDIADNSNLVRTKWLIESGIKFNHDKYPHALDVIDLDDAEKKWFDRTVLEEPDRIIYFDMDDVIVDFRSGIDAIKGQHPDKDPESHKANWDEVPGIFAEMKPYKGAIEAVRKLAESNEVYILSTAPWNNPSAWADKLEWVRKFFGEEQFNEDGSINWLYKRLIISHNKHLNQGEYLIDDRLANGAGNFKGVHVHFGPENSKADRKGDHPDWAAVLDYFKKEGLIDRK